MNKNMPEDLKKVNADSTPDMGTRVPASKDGRGDTDTLKAKHNSAPLGQPKVDAGAAKRALDKQLGRTPSDKLGDATCHENSGCCDCD